MSLKYLNFSRKVKEFDGFQISSHLKSLADNKVQKSELTTNNKLKSYDPVNSMSILDKELKFNYY